MSNGLSLPCVIYLKVSDIKNHHLKAQFPLERPIFQFSAYASTKAGARAINNQLQTALNDYQGTLSGLVIQKIELQNEYSTVGMDGATRYYLEDLEYEVNFVRP